jgi:glyoxylase-like metal-dependent hydrolase (beta-lactamase superfamily II)
VFETEARKMRVWKSVALALASALTVACGAPAGSLQAAADNLGAATTTSIDFSGTGRWFQFGQAPNPTLPWPAFDVTDYTASFNYTTPSGHVTMTRKQVVEPGRLRPAPVEQRPDQFVLGTVAWNLAVPAGAPPGAPPVAGAQPAAVEERTMEIYSTPHGFLKAALANNATSMPSGSGSEVSFTLGGHRYEGIINAQNQVEQVQTWIDNPVTGDTLVETRFLDYKDMAGVLFPGRITRSQGGHPVLDLTVTSARANVAAAVTAPPEASTPPVPVQATSEDLAPGVFYIKGGTHHSVAVDQGDHIVVIEGPQTEARGLAVIAKVKEVIPGKPIRYLVNTHVHFDHSGGLRPFVDEGATIVTHEMNKPYYETAWAATRTINPDRLAQSKKAATFETFSGKHTLAGTHAIEIYPLVGNGHNDAFAMAYLPREGILVEADAYTPTAADAPPPAAANPFSVNLYENVQNLKLNVKLIAALHGPRVTTVADLKKAILMP